MYDGWISLVWPIILSGFVVLAAWVLPRLWTLTSVLLTAISDGRDSGRNRRLSPE